MKTLVTMLFAAAAMLVPAAGDEEAAAPAAVRDGQLLYSIYCTGCHGESGRGDGPTAPALSRPPADLTRLSRGNDGVFPSARVILAIDGRTRIPGHLRGEMPIWGLSLRDPGTDSDQERQVGVKIQQLVAYLESIQQTSSAGD